MSLHTITVTLPAGLEENQVGRFAETLSENALSTSLLRIQDPFHGPWRVQWLVDSTPDRAEIVALLALAGAVCGIDAGNPEIAELAETNWLEQSYRQFPPFTVGPFFIHGSHYDGAPPTGAIALQIDAATAFGSGEHGTTSGCLLLLDQLKQDGFTPSAVLDMGCGSGILAIAACKLWTAPVLAVDIDPESIRVAANHAKANGVTLHLQAGDGFVVVSGAFDLIIANILPVPLKDMAASLIARTTPAGWIMLSGMLLEQAADVLAVYEANGVRLVTRLDRGEWTALLLQKAGA